MTTNQTIDGVRSRAIEWAFERLEICQDQAFQSCECEECEQCGKMPDECSGTECAMTCQCSTCDHCSNALAMAELRALLDAPASAKAEPANIADALESSDWSGTSIGNKVLVAAAITELRKAANHEGEPVATVSVWHVDQWYASDPSKAGRNVGVKFSGDTSGLTDGQPLYAEQPAPVAPTPINYGALDPVERLAVCRGEVAPVAVPHLEMAHVVRAHMEIPGCPVLTSNQCHTLAMKLNACLDELKRLNGIER